MKFLVLGAGRQGVAIIHDILSRNHSSVTVADRDQAALDAAQRRFPGIGVTALDFNELWSVARALERTSVCVSAAPYFYNLVLAKTAVENGVHFCDLGGNAQIVLKELQLDTEARKQGVAVIPDCGLSPGMTNILAAFAISKLERVDSLEIRAGWLPSNQLVFNTRGLLNRLLEPAGVVEEGVFKRVESLGGVEPVSFDGYPKLEAFHSHGAVSTLPETYLGRVKNLNAKTIANEGCSQLMRTLVKNPMFKSRGEVERYLERTLPAEGPDAVLVRVRAIGSGRACLELADTGDPAAGLSATMRTSGFSAGIVAQMLASNRIPPGAHVPEKAIPAAEFIDELKQRGLNIKYEGDTRPSAR